MEVTEMFPVKEKEFSFDCGWDRYGLVLHPEEYAVYSLVNPGGRVIVDIMPAEGSEGEVQLELTSGDTVRISPTENKTAVLACSETEPYEKLKIIGVSGRVVLDRIIFKSLL